MKKALYIILGSIAFLTLLVIVLGIIDGTI